jgi:hypothetical protein
MARTHAFLQTRSPIAHPNRTRFCAHASRVLREAGGQFWVELDEAQVDSFVAEGFLVSTFAAADVVDLGPLTFRPVSRETPQPPAALQCNAADGRRRRFLDRPFRRSCDKAWLVDIALAGGEQVQLIDALTSVFSLLTGGFRGCAGDAMRGLRRPLPSRLRGQISILTAAEQEFTASIAGDLERCNCRQPTPTAICK